jgi:HPt (histidine-containing phosphotransfer) domain-containing protein
VDHASAHIRSLLAGDDPGAAADAAWATADTLHAAAAALGSRILRQAADAYDRAARAPYGRTPAPTPAGDGLRRAARLLAAYGYITSDPSFRPLVLIIRLAVLAEAVADLRQSQQHAAQAAGALRAAQQLHAARGIYAAPAAAGQRPARSAATLAGAGFPAPPAPDPATPAPPRPRPSAPPRPGQQPRRQ